MARIRAIEDCVPGSQAWLHEKRHEWQEKKFRLLTIESKYSDYAYGLMLAALLPYFAYGVDTFVNSAFIIALLGFALRFGGEIEAELASRWNQRWIQETLSQITPEQP